jgi:4-carboxymuconolactone decarboxylase
MSRVPPASPAFETDNDWNITKTLANATGVLKGFSRFVGHMKQGSEVSDRVREAVILSIGAKLECDYEWGRHVPRAEAAGFSADTIRGLRTGDLQGLAPDERVAVLYALQVESVSVDEVTWNELKSHFSDSESVELTMWAAFYGLVCRTLLALEVQLDDDVRGLDYP